MSFLIDNWMLILLALVSGGMLLVPQLGNMGNAIGTAEAVRLLNREKGVLIDVGEPAEFASGHAAGARNVPFGALEGARELPGNKTLPLVVMCPSGARSGRAVGLLRKAGYANAVALSGGTAAWRDANLPIEKKG